MRCGHHSTRSRPAPYHVPQGYAFPESARFQSCTSSKKQETRIIRKKTMQVSRLSRAARSTLLQEKRLEQQREGKREKKLPRPSCLPTSRRLRRIIRTPIPADPEKQRPVPARSRPLLLTEFSPEKHLETAPFAEPRPARFQQSPSTPTKSLTKAMRPL